MHITLNTIEIAHALLKDEYSNWSYNGAYALAEYMEQYEEDTGTPLELDVVAIRCDYSEYPNALEYATQFSSFTPGKGNTTEENEQKAIDFLQENTQVITFDGGIIVQTF